MFPIFLNHKIFLRICKMYFSLHNALAGVYLWVSLPMDRALNVETKNLFPSDTSATH